MFYVYCDPRGNLYKRPDYLNASLIPSHYDTEEEARESAKRRAQITGREWYVGKLHCLCKAIPSEPVIEEIDETRSH